MWKLKSKGPRCTVLRGNSLMILCSVCWPAPTSEDRYEGEGIPCGVLITLVSAKTCRRAEGGQLFFVPQLRLLNNPMKADAVTRATNRIKVAAGALVYLFSVKQWDQWCLKPEGGALHTEWTTVCSNESQDMWHNHPGIWKVCYGHNGQFKVVAC